MGVSTETIGATTIIRPDGPTIEASNAFELRDAFESALSSGSTSIILDMEFIDYMDSVGLGAIVSGRLRLKSKASIHVCGLCERVDRLFQVSRLNLVFPVHESVQAAKAAIG